MSHSVHERTADSWSTDACVGRSSAATSRPAGLRPARLRSTSAEQHEPPLPLVSQRQVDWRLAVVAMPVWVAAWVAVGCSDASGCIALSVALAIIAAVALVAAKLCHAAAGRRAGWAQGCALVAIAASVSVIPAVVAAIRIEHRTPHSLEQLVSTGATSDVVVVITGAGKPVGSKSHFGPPKMRFAAALEPYGTPVVLLVQADEQTRTLAIGSTVEVSVRAQPTDAQDRAVAVLFATGAAQLRAPPHPLLQLSHDARQSLAAIARQLPAPGNMLVPGLAAGDEQLVSDELDADMKVTSLTHLTAVSGSNIAIVVACVLLLGRSLGIPRAIRVALALPVLAVFVLLVTPQGSVVRATAMAVVVLLVDLSGRRVAGLPVLALAVSVLCSADPWLARDYGFALSVAATAGLLIATGPMADWLSRWLPKYLATVIAVPVVAQVACQPILLLLEPSLPTYGIVANILAAPAAPVATIIGLGAVIAVVAMPAIAEAMCWLAWLPAQWIGMVAHAFAHLPGASLPWPPGVGGALSWCLVIAALVIVVRRARGRIQRGVRMVSAAALAAVLVLTLAIGAGRVALRVRDFPHDWRFVACDVGQGDALLIRAGSQTVLVDVGLEPEPLRACLREFGIQRIDVLVLTHFDADHAGAADRIPVSVASVWVPDTVDARREPITRQFQQAGVPVAFVAAGDSAAIGDQQLSVLWPRREGTHPSSLQDNDGSIVLRIDPATLCSNSCLRLLLLGDSGERVQQQLEDDALVADVVKVAHHGSRDQHGDTYVVASAQLAIISVGMDNGYGHPTSATLAMLRAARTPWLRTDRHGHIAVSQAPDTTQLVVWTSRSEREDMTSG